MGKLAELIVRRPRRVIGAWVALAVVGLGLAGGLSDELANRGYGVPGSDSAAAEDLKERHFAAARGTRVFVSLTTRAADRSALEAEAARTGERARREADVASVGAPIYAPDSKAALVPVVLDLPFPEAQKRIEDLRTAVRADRPPGVESEILGDAALYDRYTTIAQEDLARAEQLSFPAPLILLLVAFLSVVAAGLPILSAGVALSVTFGALYLAAQLTNMSVFSTNTAVVLGIGLSIDFALFMVMRFRELLADGRPVPDAVRGAVQTTGRAIVLSGLTVGTSLAALLVVGVGLFTSMAIGAIVATFVAAAAGATLVPAVLAVLGRRIDRLSLGRARRAANEARLWHRLGHAVVRRRAPATVAAALVLLALAAPLLGSEIAFRTTGDLPGSDAVREQSDRVTASFGEGTLASAEIVTRAPPQIVTRAAAAVEGVRAVRPAGPASGGWSGVDALLTDPPDSEEAEATVGRLRRTLDSAAAGAPVHVGGQTAQNLDLADRISARTPAVVALALIVAALALGIGFRSLLIPLKAVLTTALTVGASLGLVTLLFVGLGDEAALGYFVPLLLFAIVFGLSIDYEVFLISRVREEYLATGDNDEAIRRGLVRTGRSITLAAAVMITVFLIFAASSLVTFQQLGVGLAVAVLLDATLVRAVLVPATLSLLGDRNWWLPGLRRKPVRAEPAA